MCRTLRTNIETNNKVDKEYKDNKVHLNQRRKDTTIEQSRKKWQLTHNNNKETGLLVDQPREYHYLIWICQFCRIWLISREEETPDVKWLNVLKRSGVF